MNLLTSIALEKQNSVQVDQRKKTKPSRSITNHHCANKWRSVGHRCPAVNLTVDYTILCIVWAADVLSGVRLWDKCRSYTDIVLRVSIKWAHNGAGIDKCQIYCFQNTEDHNDMKSYNFLKVNSANISHVISSFDPKPAYERPTASSKANSSRNATICFLFQFPVHSSFLKVNQ